MKKIALLILLLSLFSLSAVFAQEPDEQPITAEVVYPVVNIRSAPNALEWDGFGENTRIGQLQMGDVLIVHEMETVELWYYSSVHPWVYATHEASGLRGWVRSDLLRFSVADWQQHLPQVNNLGGLIEHHIEQSSIGTIRTFIRGNAVGTLAALYDQAFGGQEITRLKLGTPVTVLGRAERNGESACLAYIRDETTGQEGWVMMERLGQPIFYFRSVYTNCTWFDSVPVVYSDSTPNYSAPYMSVLAYVYQPGLRLRAEPHTDAPIIENLAWQRVIVHGRTSHDVEGWTYITTNAMQNGWVFDPDWNPPLLYYPNGETRRTLPILDPSYSAP